MKKLINSSLGLLVGMYMSFMLIPSISIADDTDIYLTGSSPSSSEPMVMFVIDYRPNLGSTICNSFNAGDTDATIATNCGWDVTFVGYFTAADKADGVINYFELLRASLVQTMEPLDGIKIGLMMNHDDTCTGNNASGPDETGCSNGGYILMGFSSIDSTDSNGNKAKFHQILANIPDPGGSGSHSFQGKELYFEFFRYLTGQAIHNGHLGWRDFSTNNSQNLDVDNPSIDWDTTIESGLDYVTPLNNLSMTCTRIFVVNFIFQVSNQEDDSDDEITDTKGNGGMNSLSLAGSANSFDTVINWMYQTDLADGSYGTALDIDGTQNVISYFLVQSPNNTTNGYASAGGTGSAVELGTDPDNIRQQLTNIFNQILSVSTTFVSASVPVNVFNRTEFLDDLYIALFQAEENGKPRWVGNLKKLRFTTDVNGFEYVGDANDLSAFAGDGRINYNVLTFWTDASGADVIAADASVGEISGFDGRSVSRGGAGQQINGILTGGPGLLNSDIGARRMFTEPNSYTNGVSTAMMALDATSSNASTLWPYLNADGVISSGTTQNASSWSAAGTYGAATAAEQNEALELLKFARGIDVNDDDLDGDTTDSRPWILGDPIHSRPLTINYGITTAGYTESAPDVRIIMGGNDGTLHMFKNIESNGSESGDEVWAFMPRYPMNIMKRLKDDTPGTPLHPYGIDGAPVVYRYDANSDGSIIAADGDKVYVYFGLRRGGRYYYALDISDPDTPKMLWSISDNDADFSELGLTFSAPRVARLSYDSNVKKPVLIFGGGYDTNKDTRSNSPGSDDSRGNAVYIVDAEDGSLIWKITEGGSTGYVSSTEYSHEDLEDSIPAEIAAVDTNGDGSVDRMYFGDTGGTIWRADMAGTNRSSWTVTKFAVLGRHYANQKRHDRRFFHSIDFVQTLDDNGPYDAIIIGSGDRTNPLDTGVGSNEPENWMYMIKDRYTTSGSPPPSSYDHDDFADMTDNCVQDPNITCSVTQTTLLQNGWKLSMNQADGEKVLSAPITLTGIIFFTSYMPPSTSGGSNCGPAEGDGLLYAISLQDASAAYNFDLTNTVTDAYGEVYEIQTTDRYKEAGVGIPADVIAVGPDEVYETGSTTKIKTPNQTNWRTFWYIIGE